MLEYNFFFLILFISIFKLYEPISRKYIDILKIIMWGHPPFSLFWYQNIEFSFFH